MARPLKVHWFLPTGGDARYPRPRLRAGLSEFILSGYPHLEEAYWFGEGVMPELRRRGLLPALDGPDAPVFSFR